MTLRSSPVPLLAALGTLFLLPPAGASGQGGVSPPRALTAGQIQRIDAIFQEYDNTRSPGCAVGVLRGDGLILSRGYGMSNLDHGIAITPETVFRTGSVGKQFTAGVIVLLAQEGVLSLDDDIREYFPEIPDYGTPITIRHLLHHTSGIRDYLELMAMRGVGDEATYTEDDVVELLARQEALNFPPGSQFLYSNSGYLLLSRLVFRATGRTLREEGERLIFHPLGMRVTHYHDDHREVVPHRATGYGRGQGGAFEVDQTTLDIVGDGGVFTSIEELALWMRNFWTLEIGGQEWLGTQETRGVLNDGEVLGYAMGLRHGTHRGLATVGHGGAFVGFRAATLRYPEEETAVMVLCNYNRTDPSTLAESVGEVVLEDQMGPAPETRPEAPEPPGSPALREITAEEARELAGHYYSPEVDSTLRLFQGEDSLTLDVNGGWEVLVAMTSDGNLQAGYMRLEIVSREGTVTGLRAGSGRASGILFHRR